MRVLVAEDDTQVLAVLTNCLARWGYQVAVAGDGESALRAFEQNPDIKLAILNWMLPDVDGLVISRNIRIRRPGVRTIVVVGNRYCAEIRDAFRSWADHFVGRSHLLSILRALCDTAESAASPEQMSFISECLPLEDTRNRQRRSIRTPACGAAMSNHGARWN